ncbi:MAG: BTAD domain-containing putative transcriptional regulator [Pseudomonadota bacterium]
MAECGLAFRLSGPLTGTRDGVPLRLSIAGTTRGLLAYLLIHAGRALRKEHLGDLLWPDSDGTRRRSALNSAVHRLRKVLSGTPASLVCGGDTLCLTLAREASVDAQALREAVERAEVALDAGAALALTRVLAETERPFLEDIDEDWALAARERLFELRLSGLALLMQWHIGAGRFGPALAAGREIVEADPLRESAQCDLMWLYVLNGERARALRQFAALEARLEADLAISPMEETRALYAHIRFGLECRSAAARHPLPDRFATLAPHTPQQIAV